MKLTDAERAKLAAAIKHFEALQKRYTSTHNGTACEHVRMALTALDRLTQEPEVQTCASCRWCRESDKTNRLFCFANGLESEFETFGDEYCSGYARKEGT